MHPILQVMDGRFVPNITIGPLVVDALRPVTDKVLDCHLVSCVRLCWGLVQWVRGSSSSASGS